MKNLLFLCCLALNLESQVLNSRSVVHPVVGQKGMVVTQHFIASKIGREVLQSGGNAFDATVAVSFALAVVLPRAGNIGGGGFAVIYHKDENVFETLDYREKASENSSRDMYLINKEFDPKLSTEGYKAIAVPGTVDGMWELHQKYGSLPWKDLIQPAIKLASQGFRVTPYMADTLNSYQERFYKFKTTRKIFYKKDGFKFNDVIIQKDLAKSLKLISTNGRKSFYEGQIAKKIVADMKKNDGILTLNDLKQYRSSWRKPLIGDYRGYKIITMPPPSSGGLHLIQMLNILESFDLKLLGHNSAEYVLLLSEVMKYAFADRSKYLGDPDFVDVPVSAIISKQYSDRIASEIELNEATPSSKVLPGEFFRQESDETTHFSIADQFGNIVSNTYTLNSGYGSKVVIKDTGILMNNEMDDFSAAPGIPNQFGLIGGKFNEIKAFKRPLSSMTPTIVFKDNKPFLVVGSPGGPRIISAVLQNILNVIDFNMEISDAINVNRIHQQWFPDVVTLEYGMNPNFTEYLDKAGQKSIFLNPNTALESIQIKNNLFYGYGDTRRPDSKAIGVDQ